MIGAQVARTVAKGIFTAANLVGGSPPGPRILIYHQVGALHRAQLSVTAGQFRRQLDWLAREGRVVPLAEAVRRLGVREASPSYVLTFDDGYKDMVDNALPLLVERAMPFVLYVATRSVDEGRSFDVARDSVPLNWQQLDHVQATGLATLGAHTHRHLDLRQA
ncbi:MAG: polysaccharide deacetylase family protein, partial [Actinobacteria bacterium]|nr:polysaccharide deacetylase family protein [Actinomycetota bacterium]